MEERVSQVPHQAGVAPTVVEAEPDDDSIDLRELWHTLNRHRGSIIALPILVMMLAALVVTNQTPIYRATATLIIDPPRANIVSIEEVYGVDGARAEYLQTQFELLKSRSLAEDVVRELAITEHPEFDPRQQPEPAFDWRAWLRALELGKWLPFASPEDLREEAPPSEAERFEGVVGQFMSRIAVAPKRNTQLVELSIEMADRQLATQAANSLGRAYIDSQLEARLSMTQQATAWMNDRLALLKEKLRESERRLQAYREQEDLVDVSGVTTVSAEELSQVGSRMVDVRRELAAAENQYRQIEAMEDAGWRRLATVPAVLGNPLVQQFRADEASARSRVQELSRRYGPKHPKMIAARTDLNSATASLRSQVEQVVASIERNYQLAVANADSVKQSFEGNKEEIQAIQRKEFRFRELQREVDANRLLYDTFMTRLKEASATADLEVANARIVDPAIVPRGPVKPQTRKVILISGVLALFAAIGLALLRERLDNRVHGTADVEDKLQLPVLGILPQLKKVDRRELVRMYKEESDKSFAEAVRTIRTGVVLSGLDNPHKILVVTSSVPGEGKTSLATNLAFALGQMENVLLLEADMRRPSLSRSLDLTPGATGLANVVAGAGSLAEGVQRVGDIDVMHCGTVPPNPLELISSQRFTELLDELDSTYDRIVIDSPPVQAVSDALVLATHANAVVYVIKTEATPIPLVRKGLEQLRHHKAPITGVVLNQVDVRKSQRYYGYRYGYRGRYGGYGGYYDYYGYSKGAGKRSRDRG